MAANRSPRAVGFLVAGFVVAVVGWVSADEPIVTGDPWAVMHSPNGKWLAIVTMGDGAKGLELWDTLTEKPVRSLDAKLKHAGELSFSRDSSRLAAGGVEEKQVHIFDVAKGSRLAAFDARLAAFNALTDHVVSLALSPNGRCLLQANNDALARGQVYLRDAMTGDVIRKFWQTNREGEASPHCCVFSSDGKTVAASFTKGFYGVVLWETATGKETRRFTYDKGFPLPLAFSPNGRLLACGGGEISWPTGGGGRFEGELRVYDLVTGAHVHTSTSSHRDYFRVVAFSPDGSRLFAGSSSSRQRRTYLGRTDFFHCTQVICWDVATWKRVWTAVGEPGYPHRMSVSPDGQWLIVDDTSGFRRLNAENGEWQRVLLRSPRAKP